MKGTYMNLFYPKTKSLMKKFKNYLFFSILFLFHFANYSQFLENMNASFESYSAYYLDDKKTGDFKLENRFRSNNYLNLKSIFAKNWNFELQIESYMPKPLLNYSPNFENTNISTLKFEYNIKDLNIVFGSIYEQFGSGTSLRTWEDKSLGINNSLLGLNVNYKLTDEINLTSLIGQQKKGFKYSKGFVFGVDSEIDISQLIDSNSTFLFGLSYVGRNDQEIKSESFDNLTNLYSARIDYSGNAFYTNLEITQKSNNPILVFGTPSDTFIKKGSAYLLNTGFFNKGLGLDFTFRRLENMTLYSEIAAAGNEFNESIVNYLPALTKQHDYSLTNLYVYAAQPDVNFYVEDLTKAGEIGFQTDLYYSFKKESFFGGKYGTSIAANFSLWNNLGGKYDFLNQSYKTDFLSFGEKYFSELSFEIRKKWSESFENIFLYVNQYYDKRMIEFESGQVKSNIFVVDNTFKINDKKSFRLELQHLSTKNDNKNWYAYGIEYNISSSFSIYYNNLYNYQNPDKDKKINYYNFGGSYTKGMNRLALNYGRQRGGLVCTGGICRYVPESTGITFSIITSIF